MTFDRKDFVLCVKLIQSYLAFACRIGKEAVGQVVIEMIESLKGQMTIQQRCIMFDIP